MTSAGTIADNRSNCMPHLAERSREASAHESRMFVSSHVIPVSFIVEHGEIFAPEDRRRVRIAHDQTSNLSELNLPSFHGTQGCLRPVDTSYKFEML